MGEKVWVAVYDHNHGQDVRVFKTEAQALTWREAIADEWWDKEIGTERPATLEVLADEYWEEMGMRLGSYETFHFQEAEIE